MITVIKLTKNVAKSKECYPGNDQTGKIGTHTIMNNEHKT